MYIYSIDLYSQRQEKLHLQKFPCFSFTAVDKKLVRKLFCSFWYLINVTVKLKGFLTNIFVFLSKYFVH